VNSAALLRADATGSQTAGSHAGRAGATPAGHGHPRRIAEARLSAGGVAPVPLFLARTSAHLAGKEATARLVREALEMAQQEISPIDDVRGSAAYKRLALRQLLIAHVLGAFPEELQGEDWR
jgi:CO/xanthine dehydrogenase FAD-binding subunit